MRKRKRTQKQKAVRNAWALLLLCTVIAVLSTGFLVLFPQQAIRYEEVYAGLGETKILSHQKTRCGEFYLSANETTLLVTPFHRGWRTTPHREGGVNVGWQGWSEASACDLTQQEGPFYAHLFSAVLGGKEEESVTHLYGRVDVEGAWSILGWNDAAPTLEPRSQTLLRGKDRHLYFWFITYGSQASPAPVYTDFAVLAEDGRELGRYHISPLHAFLYL